jgi:uncharacterized repeat protein (TIGR01451 family)
LAFLTASVFAFSFAAQADILNQATASGEFESTVFVSDPADFAVPVAPATPDVGLVKTAGAVVDANNNGIQDAGDTIAYTFTVSNLGNVTLNPVSVTDPLVPNITCAATSLDPQNSTVCAAAAPYVLTLADINSGSVSNQATASGTPPTGPAVTDLSDPATPGSKDNAQTVSILSPVSLISIVKTVSSVVDSNTNGVTDAGDQISYLFTVENVGSTTLNGVSVVDNKIGPVTCVAATLLPATQTTCSGAPYTIIQADMDLAKVVNQATATGLTPANATVSDLSDGASFGSGLGKDDPTVTVLPQTAKIGLVKSAGAIDDANNDGKVDAGDTIAYVDANLGC